MLRAIVRRFGVVVVAFVAALFALGAAAAEGDYLLGAGDVIKVGVFQNPDLTVETRISESGEITFPLLGSVKVGGLSIGAAENKVAAGLRDGGFVMKPQVNILLTQLRGNQVSVLGMVGRPGRFPLEVTNTRLTDALALAGGPLQQGSDIVVVAGIRDGKPVRFEVDIAAIFLDKSGAQDVALRNGDVIYVHRAPTFYVYGEVQRPGGYRVERHMTVMQALALGGGPTLRGTLRGLELHRRDESGKVQLVTPQLDDAVRPDDVIYVKESLF